MQQFYHIFLLGLGNMLCSPCDGIEMCPPREIWQHRELSVIHTVCTATLNFQALPKQTVCVEKMSESVELDIYPTLRCQLHSAFEPMCE